jgi:group I intron endonuclease
MTILEFVILVLPTPTASLNLSTILSGSAFSIFLFLCLLSHDSSWSIEKLGGLFQASFLPQGMNNIFKILFIFLLCGSGCEEEGGSLGESYILFSDISFQVSLLGALPVIVYSNAETAKSTILVDNKGKSGVYMWTHKESGKKYVGSSVDLSKRFKVYYSKNRLVKHKTSYINNALLQHDYLAFSLTIIEYIDINNLSKEEARLLILRREQHYIDSLEPEYNILSKAGSSLGYKHTEESLTKISQIHKGRTVSTETKIKMSEAKTGENHPLFGKLHSAETKAILSEARLGLYHIM